ncbi:hypothetical protein Hanom_Chr02g00130271 [Helianthus anomalus]
MQFEFNSDSCSGFSPINSIQSQYGFGSTKPTWLKAWSIWSTSSHVSGLDNLVRLGGSSVDPVKPSQLGQNRSTESNYSANRHVKLYIYVISIILFIT